MVGKGANSLIPDCVGQAQENFRKIRLPKKEMVNEFLNPTQKIFV